MSDQENYTADKPICEETEDRFQRGKFSKRIAETIINRKSDEGIVFGLFGAWGEGKSSVLNLIDKELKKTDNIISINFNPWRYVDEDSLLKNFFYEISKALDKDLDKWYEKLFGFLGKVGGNFKYKDIGLEGIAKLLSTVGIETFKKRVNQFLIDSKNKLVIIIDDIDRLDKKEMYAIFRLVKLTADFSKTTYILSFDNNMVAAAIGDQFGEGGIKSGDSFLEKIIQVPLNLPKAQPDALKNFSIELIESAFSVNTLSITKEEWEEFINQFTTNVLSKIGTPRLALRYGNALSFSLPLLHGEVNLVDLMLIEATKVFYPQYYNFIKHNSNYFTGSYHLYENTKDEDKIKAFRTQTDELNKELNQNERFHISDLLSYLFPTLNTIYENDELSDRARNKAYANKRIASSYYFDRYFSYTVIIGDISDIEFDELIRNGLLQNIDKVAQNMRDMIRKTDPGNFIFKLRSKETNLEWDKSKTLVKAIYKITDVLPNYEGSLSFGYESTKGQAALFVYHILKNHKEQDIFDFAKELMTLTDDIDFSYSINNWLRSGKDDSSQLFSYEQYKKIAEIFTATVLKDVGDVSIFNKFQLYPDKLHYIMSTWVERDKSSFDAYLLKFLNQQKNNVITFLKSIIPMGRSNARSGEYKSDLTKQIYDYIISLIDKTEFFGRLLQIYSLEEIEKEQPFMIDFGENEFTDLNMVRQFYKWYKADIQLKD
jgi:predicted KAP-like P-loop ATPase